MVAAMVLFQTIMVVLEVLVEEGLIMTLRVLVALVLLVRVIMVEILHPAVLIKVEEAVVLVGLVGLVSRMIPEARMGHLLVATEESEEKFS